MNTKLEEDHEYASPSVAVVCPLDISLPADFKQPIKSHSSARIHDLREFVIHIMESQVKDDQTHAGVLAILNYGV
jgi:hypothetical protein